MPLKGVKIFIPFILLFLSPSERGTIVSDEAVSLLEQ